MKGRRGREKKLEVVVMAEEEELVDYEEEEEQAPQDQANAKVKGAAV